MNNTFEAFSLEEEGIQKDNPKFFTKLMEKFNLRPEEIIYFDHKEENVKTAKELGIKSSIYQNPEQIKKFIEEND